MSKQSARNAGIAIGRSLAVLAVNESDPETFTRRIQAALRLVPKDQQVLALDAALVELATKLGQAVDSIDLFAPGFRVAFRDGMNDGLIDSLGLK